MPIALRRSLLALVIALVSTAALAGDTPGKIELGFVPFSITHMSSDSQYGDDSVTVAQAGGGSFFSTERLLYLQVFATDKLAIEPQISATGIFTSGDDMEMLGLSLRANYLFSGANKPSPYLFAGGGLWYINADDDSETDPSLGFGIGFRQPIRTAGSIRIEVGYERIFNGSDMYSGSSSDLDTNVLRFALGFGLRF